jgi:hypothetical protein
MINRMECEATPEWRATIQTSTNLVFVLEGRGSLAGKFYEHSDGWPGRQPPELEEHKRCRQLAAGDIALLKGAIPHIKEKRVRLLSGPLGRIPESCR